MNTAKPNHSRTARLLAAFIAVLVVTGFTVSSVAANLVAHWNLNEAASPYADSGPNGIPLTLDPSTTPAVSGTGLVGSAGQLNWQAVPGTSTRLSASGTALQNNSFGFSFWMNPSWLDQFNNLLGKEMAYTNTAGYLRMAWQLQFAGATSSNTAPLELVVRGDDRNVGDFFGAVSSGGVTIPLGGGASGNWIHVAGGYDAVSGALSLFVNGAGSFAGGTPGAHCSDGSPLSLGTGKNGSDVVAFAASAYMDEVQIYDAPLTAAEVAFLKANPGKRVADQPMPALAAHWKLDEANPPYTNAGPNTVDLLFDDLTTPALTDAGLNGTAAGLAWNDPPGTSTRLYATNAAIQTDSFGFSFWLRPNWVGDWDNLMMKELVYDPIAPSWARLAWQLHFAGNDGTGGIPLELIVRGAVRTNEDHITFFGVVSSGTHLPYHANSTNWFHIAGGYDAQSGAISLYVDGAGDSSVGTPGAVHSDGSPLSIGTARNGAYDFNAFAAGAWIDDVQMYAGPLTAAQAALLRANPGKTLAELTPFNIRNFSYDSITGAMVVTYDSVSGQNYEVQASTNLLTGWTGVAQEPASGSTTTTTVAKEILDTALGSAPRSQLFVRMKKL